MRKLALVVCLAAVAACTPAPVVVTAPTTPLHPDFVYPDPPPGTPSTTAARVERGWRLLQANDFAAAERELSAVPRAERDLQPVRTAQGYLALARRRPADALAHFDAAVATPQGYAPALVGRGLTLLESGRTGDALASFEEALAINPALPDLASRIEVLRVRQMQDRVSRAERAAAAGQWDEASAAYHAAIAASAESAFLYRDAAKVERSAGRADRAIELIRQAIALDGEDARAHVVLAELLADREDFDGALAAYGEASALDPSAAIDASVARIRERAREAARPAEFHAIPSKEAATRADLAALLGVRLEEVLARAPQRPVVLTDVRGNWAETWIEAAARAGAMEVFPNYTFQPAAPLRRGDLADVVSRVLGLMPATSAARQAWDTAPVTASDVPAGHLAYPAVRRAVASGVLPLDGAVFHLLRPVSGAELAEAIARLAGQGAARR